MKNIHKFLKQWVLPPNVYRSIGQVYFELNGTAHPENARFKNKYAGKRCFVIGTGPSLSLTPLDKIAGDDISIVVNRFYLYDKEFKPTFCCMADRSNDSDTDLFREIVRKTTPAEGFFLHESLEPDVSDIPGNKYYFRTSVAMDTLLDIRKDWDFHSHIPGGSSASLTALTLALYLGCNPVYLIGTDCNWLTHRGINAHCYDADNREPHLADVPYPHITKQALRQFRSYAALKQYADYRNIQVYNATPGSFLDVFPMADFTNL